MNQKMCTFSGNREETMIAFIYDELSPADRDAFAAHSAACLVCRSELAGLSRVREQLQLWAPPEPALSEVSPATVAPRGAVPVVSARADETRRSRAWAALRELPVWAQVAAAMLVLGISAGIANLEVTTGAEGLTVRTGWSAERQVAQAADIAGLASRDDLVALEAALRQEIGAAAAARPVALTTIGVNQTGELLRKVRALVEESEQKQHRALALGVATLREDVRIQRNTDLVEIQRVLERVANSTTYEVRQNREALNSLALRVSQQR